MNKILRNSIVAAMVLGTVATSSFYNYTYAKGQDAVQEGTEANASGSFSVAIGSWASADKSGGVAVGSHATVHEKGGVGIGSSATVKAEYGIAVGCYSKVNEEYSLALGAHSIATDKNEFSVGTDKDQNSSHPNALYRRITHVADGTGDHDAVTLSQAKALVSAGLDQKMDKSALDGYAKTTDLATKANTSDLDAYAKKDATNITGESLTKWQSALGNGTIAENNSGLVTGGKVFDAIKDKADKSELSDYAKATDLTALKTQVTNITDGTTKIDVTNIDLATNNTFKTLQTSVEGKANKNADNITVSDWATKLGTGTVATGDTNLVTGGTVYTALTDLETKVTNITNGTTQVDGSKINLATNTTFTGLQTTVNGKANVNADNITVSDWAGKLGTGAVACLLYTSDAADE